MGNNTRKHTNLLNRLAKEFARGIALIDSLNDEIYTRTKNGVGSVGAHIRHNLDFSVNFLKGIEKREINYNLRERNLRIEQDRQYASEQFVFLIRRLRSISDNTDDILDSEVLVCSEVDDTNWYKSTGARELEFLHSHTVHHYALIVEKLKSYGIDVSPDFGVAPSTLKYWAEQDAEAKVA